MRVDLLKLVHTLIVDNTMPAKEIAKKLGKPYSTLLREINPYDTGAKLGIDTLVQIIKITGNISPLAYIASQLGYQIVPKNDCATE